MRETPGSPDAMPMTDPAEPTPLEPEATSRPDPLIDAEIDAEDEASFPSSDPPSSWAGPGGDAPAMTDSDDR